MDHGIPEGYYSILEVFDFLGADMFKFGWSGQEAGIGKDDLLGQKFPKFIKHFFGELYSFSRGLRGKNEYKDFIEIEKEKVNLWCDLKTQLTDNIAEQIYLSRHTKDKISIDGYAYPDIPHRVIDDFALKLMQCFVARIRMISMLGEALIKTYIRDEKTGNIQAVPQTCWRRSERLPVLDFELDFFSGVGLYKFQNGPVFEIFKGPFFVSKKSFDCFRRGKSIDFAPDSFPLIKEESAPIQKIPTELIPALKGSAYMMKMVECYDYFKLDENPLPPDREIEKWIKDHASFIKTKRKIDYFIAFLREPGRKKKTKKT